MAQRLAEGVGREYIRNAIERRASFSNDTLRYLVEEEERLRGEFAEKRGRGGRDKKGENSARAPARWRERVVTGSQTRSGAGAGRNAWRHCRRQITVISAISLTVAKTDRSSLSGR